MNTTLQNIFKRYSLVVLFLYLFAYSTFPQTDTSHKKTTYTAGFYKKFFDLIPANDAIAAYSVWIREIEKKSNFDFTLNLKLYNDFNDMITNYKNDKLVIAIFSSYDYLTYADTSNFKPIYAPTIDNQPGIAYYIITKKNKHYDRINDLQDLSIGIPSSYLHKPAIMWLDLLLFKNHLARKEEYFKYIEPSMSESKSIMEVFFGKLDVGLVPQSSFELMCELNPQIGQQLTIIEKSPIYTNGIVCFTNVLKDTKARNDLRNKIGIVSDYYSGKQMLKLMKIDNIIPYKKIYLAPFRELIKDYKKISKKSW